MPVEVLTKTEMLKLLEDIPDCGAIFIRDVTGTVLLVTGWEVWGKSLFIDVETPEVARAMKFRI